MSWIVGCGLWMTSCASSPEPFFCPVAPAYNAQGVRQPDFYQVSGPCLKGLSARVRACYAEAK